MSQLFSDGRQQQLQYIGVPSTVSIKQQGGGVTEGNIKTTKKQFQANTRNREFPKRGKGENQFRCRPKETMDMLPYTPRR